MPRISARLVKQAASISSSLVHLLRPTGSLQLAQSELRWIKQELPRSQWCDAIRRRARLEPLQYILGSQPFGLLDILCEPGALIPRWETEEWTMRLVEALRSNEDDLSILDACTGTGCIPLLIKSELPHILVSAFDSSDKALAIALKNRELIGVAVDIIKVDVLEKSALNLKFDLVTSNPPYIPLCDYHKPLLSNGTSASVRQYEPRMALIGHLEFYTALVRNIVIPCRSQGLVFELGYEDQVEATAANLPPNWTYGRYYDLSWNLRCVVAWENRSKLECLKALVNEHKP